MILDVPQGHAWRALQPIYRQAWLATAVALGVVALAAALIVVRMSARWDGHGRDTLRARIMAPTGDRPDFSMGQRFRTAWALGAVGALLLILVAGSLVTLREGMMVSPLLAIPPVVTLSAFLWALGMRVMRERTAMSELPLAALVGAMSGVLILLNLRRMGMPAGFIVLCGIAAAGAVMGVLGEIRLRMVRPFDASPGGEPVPMVVTPAAPRQRLRIR